MDKKSFIKLCKGCHLLNEKLTETNADFTFARALGKGHKRICPHQFDALLVAVAEANGMPHDEVHTVVALFAVWARPASDQTCKRMRT
jgi:hypothetical protein